MIPIRQEIHNLVSRHRNGALMYPGSRVLTWAKVLPGVWLLVDMSGAAA